MFLPAVAWPESVAWPVTDQASVALETWVPFLHQPNKNGQTLRPALPHLPGTLLLRVIRPMRTVPSSVSAGQENRTPSSVLRRVPDLLLVLHPERQRRVTFPLLSPVSGAQRTSPLASPSPPGVGHVPGVVFRVTRLLHSTKKREARTPLLWTGVNQNGRSSISGGVWSIPWSMSRPPDRGAG